MGTVVMTARAGFIAAAAGVWAVVGLACGTSKPAPSADFSPGIEASAPDVGETVDAAFADASGGKGGDPYYDCEPEDAGGGHCPCNYSLGNVTLGIPCGATVCTDGTRTTAHCTTDGHLIVVPGGFVPPFCTGDVDGSADGASPFRVCDAGTQPFPPR